MQPIFQPASEASLLLSFGNDIKLETIHRVHRLVALLDLSPLPGIEEITPAYQSILVEFDPLRLSLSDVEEHIRFCLEQIGQIELPILAKMEVPVFYGGEYGPDLPYCAERLGLSASQFVEAHCELSFTVAFFGFLPGFAYLHGWPAERSMPRLESPRPKVLSGSVGLAGQQCAIYPQNSPGGWRIIGRTPLSPIDRQRDNFSLFSLGMQIRFYPSRPGAW